MLREELEILVEEGKKNIEKDEVKLVELLNKYDPLEILSCITLLFYFHEDGSGEKGYIFPSEIDSLINYILPLKKDNDYEIFCDLKIVEEVKNYLEKIDSNKDRVELFNPDKIDFITSNKLYHENVKWNNYGSHIEYMGKSFLKEFDEYLKKNIGFTIDEAFDFYKIICKFLLKKWTLRQDLSSDFNNFFEEISFKLDDFKDEVENLKGLNNFINFYMTNIKEPLVIKNSKEKEAFIEKPILTLDNINYILPLMLNLEEVIFKSIESFIKKDGKQFTKYQNKRGSILEKETNKIFQKIFPKSNIYNSLFYKLEDEKGNYFFCELDSLILVDDNIILIEAKSNEFHQKSKDGNINNFSKNIKDIILKPIDQLERANGFIQKENNPIFYEKDGRKIKLKLDKSKFNNFYNIAVSRENLYELATQVDTLNKFGLEKVNSFPLIISIYDLLTISDHIEYGTQFLHYLDKRLKINNKEVNSPSIQTSDELDYFIWYLKEGLPNFEYEDVTMVVAPNYRPDLNKYYLEIESGKVPFPIKQEINYGIKKLIFQLEKDQREGYSGVIKQLLNINEEGKKQLLKDIIKNKKHCKKKKTSKFIDFDEYGISIFITSSKNKNLDFEKKHPLQYVFLREEVNEWASLVFFFEDKTEYIREFGYISI